MALSMAPEAWLQEMYPQEAAPALQDRLDEALAWVAYYAPCTQTPEFDTDSLAARQIRSLVKRALRYEKASADGIVTSRQAGPFNQVIDSRRPSSPNLFAPDQVTILRSLCRSAFSAPGPVSVRLTAGH